MAAMAQRPAILGVLALLRLFWWEAPRRLRGEALLRLALVVSVQLLRARVGVRLSFARRQQLEVLTNRSSTPGHIAVSVLRYFATIALLSPVNKLYWRLFRGLRMRWERYMTEVFLERYLEANCLMQGTLDTARKLENSHPDQRVAADVGKFVQLALNLSLDTLQSGINLYFNAALLHTLSPLLSRTAQVGALLGTLLSSYLGRGLPALYDAERAADGNFTYVLTRMRENAESIAFYGGQQREIAFAKQALGERQSTEWLRFARKDVVQLVGEQYRSSLGLLPAILLAREADGGRAQASVLQQAGEAFDVVFRSLSVIADNCSDFSRLLAVGECLDAYRKEQESVLLDARAPAGKDTGVCVLDVSAGCDATGAGGSSWLQVAGLSLRASGRLLINDLSFAAPPRGGFLICGPSGAGKTSLLRALLGLWKGAGSKGTIYREAGPGKVLFLPQRPYMTLGSLRDQLAYPNGLAPEFRQEDSDAALRKLLEGLGLAAVLSRVGGDLDTIRRWDEQLSLGEQQRLSVARVLAQRPAYAILDEVSSANDAAHEKLMYQGIVSVCTAFASVGHRASLEAFHSRRLRLLGDEAGAWRLEELEY
eukprot:TRINITY_DN55689_c0_g1_i1.p1 TRINITY_DN55689_c0_g1~~TRINITY_DN55689_c0_g1_i1.p1  ORF type:complete len:596 (+),score=128.53 TRINITY_DN55689_c0_g1_i1:37-1824(+)